MFKQHSTWGGAWLSLNIVSADHIGCQVATPGLEFFIYLTIRRLGQPVSFYVGRLGFHSFYLMLENGMYGML